MDLNQVNETLKKRCKVTPKSRLLVGLSGGMDSSALLLGLHELGYDLIAAHFNHHLRSGSDVDADIARRLSASIGVPFVLGERDVETFARENRLSIEEAARNARYQFLFQCAREANAQAVAVAHHANDQVETVLMNFLRGAGLDGLTGMAYRGIVAEWDCQIPIVRPFLSIWREDIEAYCERKGLAVADDPTNREAVYARNRVRLELLPILEQYNPAIQEAIWRTADILQGDAEDIWSQDEVIWQTLKCVHTEDLVQLNYSALKELTHASLRRQLRRAIETIRPGLQNLDFETLERAVSFIAQPTRSRKITLSGKMDMRLEGDTILIHHEDAKLPEVGLSIPEGWDEQILNVPGLIKLESGVCLRSALVDRESYVFSADESEEVWFDADSLELPLTVRIRKAGDRMSLFGMGKQSQKISDLMVNEKIAARLRGRWPLVCSQNNIVWVPGVRRCDAHKVTAQSTRILRIWLDKVEGYSAASSSSD